MKRKGGKDQLAVADFIDHHTADNNTEAKARKPRPSNFAQFNSGETEFSTPIGHNTSSNAEADAGRQNRHKSSP